MESKKVDSTDTEQRKVLSETGWKGGGIGKRKILLKGHKVSVRQKGCFRKLLYCVVTIVNNDVLYNSKLPIDF